MRRRVLGFATAVLALMPGVSCRRHKPEAPSQEVLATAARMEAHVYRDGALSYPVPYRLYVPPAQQPGRLYPLIVYLHGGGSRGSDNFAQLTDTNISRLISPAVQGIEPAYVLAPECPDHDEWINRHANAPFGTYDQSKFPESDALKGTAGIIDSLIKGRSIDPDRVYVTGASMGGSGTWDFITRRPHIFAAAIPVTGVSDPSRATVIKDLPIWAFHGVRDEISPVENSRAMRRALDAVHGQARFTELDGGHDAWTQAYSQRETFLWLFSQRRAAATK